MLLKAFSSRMVKIASIIAAQPASVERITHTRVASTVWNIPRTVALTHHHHHHLLAACRLQNTIPHFGRDRKPHCVRVCVRLTTRLCVIKSCTPQWCRVRYVFFNISCESYFIFSGATFKIIFRTDLDIYLFSEYHLMKVSKFLISSIKSSINITHVVHPPDYQNCNSIIIIYATTKNVFLMFWWRCIAEGGWVGATWRRWEYNLCTWKISGKWYEYVHLHF